MMVADKMSYRPNRPIGPIVPILPILPIVPIPPILPILSRVLFLIPVLRGGVRLRESKKNRSLPKGKLRPIKRSEDLRCH